tara:strand:- start:128 stop:454 length:327 start_codon:yes stop_codon:yes gene_type:complete
MEYYKVKETGAHAFHGVVNENCDLSFFYTKNLYLSNLIEISYFINTRKDTKSKILKYSELEKELKNKHIIMVEVIEKDYSIRFLGAEVWVYSFSRVKARNIYKLLDLN